jgi:hypothetical protein
LSEMSNSLHRSFAAMVHLAEGLCVNALLTLKVENSLICLVGTRILAVSIIEWQFIIISSGSNSVSNNNNNNNNMPLLCYTVNISFILQF